jgi:hypothetical protein
MSTKSYIYSLYVIILIWSHSKMSDRLGGYEIFSFFVVPRVFRYVEFAFVLLMFGYAYLRRNSVAVTYPKMEMLSIIAFVAIGLFSSFVNGVDMTDTVQGLYLFLSPLIVYATSRLLGFGSSEIQFLKRMLLVILMINILPWMYQVALILPSTQNPDDVRGILSDAHAFAVFFFMMMILYVSEVFSGSTKSRDYALFSIILFGIAFSSFNEKASIFIVPTLLAVALLLYKNDILPKIRWTTFIYVGIVIVLFISALGFFQKYDVAVRTEVIEEASLDDLGTILAYVQIPLVFSEVPQAVIYGVGAGNYGSSIAIRRSIDGNPSELSDRYVGDFDEVGSVGAFAWRTNYFLGLLVEYGFIATYFIIAFYIRIVRQIIELHRSGSLISNGPWGGYAIGSIIFLWMLASVANISNLDEGLLAFPVMMAAAAVVNIGTENRRVS